MQAVCLFRAEYVSKFATLDALEDAADASEEESEEEVCQLCASHGTIAHPRRPQDDDDNHNYSAGEEEDVGAMQI